MSKVARKYIDIRWDLAEAITSNLRAAGVDLVTSEHVRIWSPELAQYADVWAARETDVRAGKAKGRLVCPSFLYRLYASPDRQDELMNRGRTRAETVCTRVRETGTSDE